MLYHTQTPTTAADVRALLRKQHTILCMYHCVIHSVLCERSRMPVTFGLDSRRRIHELGTNAHRQRASSVRSAGNRFRWSAGGIALLVILSYRNVHAQNIT